MTIAAFSSLLTSTIFLPLFTAQVEQDEGSVGKLVSDVQEYMSDFCLVVIRSWTSGVSYNLIAILKSILFTVYNQLFTTPLPLSSSRSVLVL